MVIETFPPVENAVEGLLAFGGDLETASLINAYKKGIFPWPFSSENPVAWFSPDPRGILDYKDLHIPRSLKRTLNRREFVVKYNQDFKHIITHCASVPRQGQSATWITEEMINSYHNLFKEGMAYCVGAYRDNRLVGGIYGVCIDGIISGESMFYLYSNAGKICLIYLLEKLHSSGIDWLDTQMVTPAVKSLGGKEISRAAFFRRLDRQQKMTRQEIFG